MRSRLCCSSFSRARAVFATTLGCSPLPTRSRSALDGRVRGHRGGEPALGGHASCHPRRPRGPGGAHPERRGAGGRAGARRRDGDGEGTGVVRSVRAAAGAAVRRGAARFRAGVRRHYGWRAGCCDHRSRLAGRGPAACFVGRTAIDAGGCTQLRVPLGEGRPILRARRNGAVGSGRANRDRVYEHCEFLLTLQRLRLGRPVSRSPQHALCRRVVSG